MQVILVWSLKNRTQIFSTESKSIFQCFSAHIHRSHSFSKYLLKTYHFSGTVLEKEMQWCSYICYVNAYLYLQRNLLGSCVCGFVAGRGTPSRARNWALV